MEESWPTQPSAGGLGAFLAVWKWLGTVWTVPSVESRACREDFVWLFAGALSQMRTTAPFGRGSASRLIPKEEVMGKLRVSSFTLVSAQANVRPTPRVRSPGTVRAVHAPGALGAFLAVWKWLGTVWTVPSVKSRACREDFVWLFAGALSQMRTTAPFGRGSASRLVPMEEVMGKLRVSSFTLVSAQANVRAIPRFRSPGTVRAVHAPRGLVAFLVVWKGLGQCGLSARWNPVRAAFTLVSTQANVRPTLRFQLNSMKPP
jgi:hypothetical protein